MKERTTLTVAAAGGVVAALAVFNVAGWVITWADSIAFAVLFSAIALSSEVLGFNLAISVERQWRDKRRAAALACGYALAICMIVNLVSGHNAWLEFERIMFAPQVSAAQADIDQSRARLQLEIAAIDAHIERARPPVDMAAGPLARAEARRVYELELNRFAPQRAAAQARLDAEPVAAAQRHIVPDWVVWVVFGLIEVMKAMVLWAIGAGLARRAPFATGTAHAPARPAVPEPAQDKIDPNLAAQLSYLSSVHAKQASAWRLKHVEHRSVRGIATRMQISPTQAQRLLREADARLNAHYAANGITPIAAVSAA